MRRLFFSVHAEFHQSLADGIIGHEEVVVKGDFSRRSGLSFGLGVVAKKSTK